MGDAHAPPTVAILAFPETSASVVYGMYDLFMSAGRDWGVIIGGTPGPGLMRPLVVATQPGPFVAANGVAITPQAAAADCPAPDIVCVPELTVPPGEPLEGRFTEEIAWLRHCHQRGATLAAAC